MRRICLAALAALLSGPASASTYFEPLPGDLIISYYDPAGQFTPFGETIIVWGDDVTQHMWFEEYRFYAAEFSCTAPCVVADPDPTATPLPATLPLFAGGLGLLALLRRRRCATRSSFGHSG